MAIQLGVPVPPEVAQPGDLIGYTRAGKPIRLMAGGAEDDSTDPTGDDTDPEDDDAEGDGDDSEDTTEAVDWQARYAELEAQHQATQANLTRARKQAKALREAQKTAQASPAPVPAGATAPPAKAVRQAPAAPAEPQVVTVTDDSEVQRLQGAAVRAYAKAALISAGCDPDLIDAPLSKLRAGDVEWDDDEDEPILDEYIEDMKARYAKAFAKPEPAPTPRVGRQPRPGSIDQGAGATGRPAPQNKSFGQTLWEAGGGMSARAPRRPRV